MAERKFRRSPGDIAFDDDIILDVAEELGYTPKQISHIYASVFLTIRKYIKNPNTHGFYVPFLGFMSFKVDYARRKVEAYDKFRANHPVSSTMREKMETLREQVENFDKIYAVRSQGIKPNCHHKYPSVIHAWNIRKNYTLEELEELVNSH
jgi:hypothetical protein